MKINIEPEKASSVVPRKTMFANVVKEKALLVMMIPMFLFIFINHYMPIFGLLIAFKRVNYREGIIFSPWVGFENFKFLFATDTIWRILRNTISYNLVFILTGVLFAMILAIILNELKNRIFSKVYQSIMIMPHFLSMVVVSYVVYALLNSKYGVLNTMVLNHLGLERIDWYSKSMYWPFILFFTKIWHTLGYGTILYLATLAGIEQTMYEAAFIDGANRWQQIKYISVPMLKPVMVIVLITSLGGIIKGDFGLFYQVTLDSPALYATTDIIDTYVYRALITLNDIGMSSATGFLQSTIGCIMVLAANWIAKKVDPEQALF